MNEVSTPVPLFSCLSSLVQAFSRQPRWLSYLEVLLLLIIIGWADGITGWEWSLFVLYVIPIGLAVKLDGLRGGALVSVLCAMVWWLANQSDNPYRTELGYALAMSSRLVYFAIAAVAFAALRSRHEADALRIRLLEERRQLEQDIVAVSEHEQQRIGRDLHDGLCQQLAAIGCAMRALAEDLHTIHAGAAADVTHAEQLIGDAITEARSLARGIFPVHVDRLGLAAALSDLADSNTRLTGVPVRMIETGQGLPLTPETAMHLYRIAQEALANALRHSGAREVAIRLLMRGSHLELRVEDDGRGLPEDSLPPTRGLGLRTMQYRAQVLEAELKITPRPGGGTAVSIVLNYAHNSRQPDEPKPFSVLHDLAPLQGAARG